ncbi:HNH endonuclease [Paludisphaera soli]|uniref:HNH endonuclease n=1 Tax=Paludisphaera soli TaxID=2712865 RepID=UPI0013EB569B|nr:HNH endonuclease [Paludisphaera soli]
MPGDSETWRGVPAEPALQASDLGRIRRARDGRVYRACRSSSGYLQVGSLGRGRTAHELVAAAWRGSRPVGRPADGSARFEVDHVDGDKSNNRAINL